jgi:SAM-dependent methyltransferase
VANKEHPKPTRRTFNNMIPICGPIDDLDPEGYLYINPDILTHAHESSDVDWAEWHYEHHGKVENRIQLRSTLLPELATSHQQKMQRLFTLSPGSRPILESLTLRCCGRNLEIAKSPDHRLPVPFERISAHGYYKLTADWIDSQPDSLILDIGSGLSRDYRQNVVYVDIAGLPTVDVVSFGDTLPFDDETFDGIVCLAVLEHVPDPFAVATEMSRVLRPGGLMVIDWPFLQPVHGYPHHYFNATEEGARQAFSVLGGMEIESFTPPHMHPAFTLHWFLQEWASRLTGDVREAFLALTLADVLDTTPSTFMSEEWGAIENQTVISAGTRLMVTKQTR